MNKTDFTQLLRKFLAGSATESEKAIVDKFYDEIQAEQIEESTWTKVDRRATERKLLRRIKAKINQPGTTHIGWKLWRMAAAVGLVLVVSYQLLTMFTQTVSSQETTLIETVEATLGSRSVLLSDGSYVYLSKGSKLVFPTIFEASGREVELHGEAWFDVQRDTTRPFSVHSQSITTTVLGTSFSIDAKTTNDDIKVIVTSGKVSVKSEEKELGVLEKDEELLYNPSTKECIRKEVGKKDEVAHSAFRKEYQLSDVSMEEAMLFLQKRWKKLIVFETPSIKECRLVASFYQDDALEDILMLLCGVSNSRYKYVDDKIVIYGNGCNKLKN